MKINVNIVFSQILRHILVKLKLYVLFSFVISLTGFFFVYIKQMFYKKVKQKSVIVHCIKGSVSESQLTKYLAVI